MSQVKAAEDFMRRKLVTLSPETDVLDGVTRLLRDNISGAPVIDDDGNFLGVFSEKCCMNALTKSVETASDTKLHVPRVREFMKCELTTLSPDQDVFDSIDHLLKRRISGAPVVDNEGRYQGIFSEKTALRVLVAAVHDQLPGTNVASYMNLDRNRIIDEEDTLLEVARKFQNTPYRRLPILHGEKLAGQVSRRDVLQAGQRVAKEVQLRSTRDNSDPRMAEAAQTGVVRTFMDQAALTARSSTDMLSIAQMFLNSPYRRLPIVNHGRLIGQVSRRDLLEAAAESLRPKPLRRGSETLYVSSLTETAPPSIG
ncbi:MAG: CBS domain-containing protein [Rubripirellula sp.]